MEDDVEYADLADTLYEVQYPVEPSAADLVQWVAAGEGSKQFVDLCNFFTMELLGQQVGTPFYANLSKLLTQLQCNIDTRQVGKDPVARLMVLEFLAAELATHRVREKQRLEVQGPATAPGAVTEESGTIRDSLTAIAAYLNAKKTPSANQVLAQAGPKVGALLAKQDLSPVITQSALTEQEQTVLREINRVLFADYSKRRQTVLTRFKVTLQSFEWTDKKDADVSSLVTVSHRLLAGVRPEPNVRFDHLFCISRPLLCGTELKISGEDRRKLGTIAIHRNISIGAVPDRGGRTNTYNFELRVEQDVARSNAELKGKHYSDGKGKGKGKHYSDGKGK
eukprot:EG_transcript_19068